MKPGKHQRRKQICQDLCWKVHGPAQSFVLRSYTTHYYVTNTFLLVGNEYGVINYCILSMVKAKRANTKKNTTKDFVGFHNQSNIDRS